MSIFNDVRKAFDTICYAGLFEELESYEIVGNTLQFIQSYLDARRQQAVINKYCSIFTDVTCGVPQGSVLGVILFSLYVKDLPPSLKYTKVVMYADDTALVYTGKSNLSLKDVILKEIAIIN